MVTMVNPSKMAELIQMLFGIWAFLDPRNRVLDGGSISAVGTVTFVGHSRAHPLLPVVNMLNIVCQGAAAM